MDLSPDQHAALDKITAELAAAAGPALPGTLTVRAYACGKTRCRCHADPPQLHGPYAEWTRKIGGKTITRRLTDAELADWQPLFDNARKLRTLLAQLQDLTLAIIEGQPGQGPIAQTGQNPVGSARLTCGRGRCRPSSTQLSAKREDLTRTDLVLYPFSYPPRLPFPGHVCSMCAREFGPSRPGLVTFGPGRGSSPPDRSIPLT